MIAVHHCSLPIKHNCSLCLGHNYRKQSQDEILQLSDTTGIGSNLTKKGIENLATKSAKEQKENKTETKGDAEKTTTAWSKSWETILGERFTRQGKDTKKTPRRQKTTKRPKKTPNHLLTFALWNPLKQHYSGIAVTQKPSEFLPKTHILILNLLLNRTSPNSRYCVNATLRDHISVTEGFIFLSSHFFSTAEKETNFEEEDAEQAR